MKSKSVFINSQNRTKGTISDFRTTLVRPIKNITCCKIRSVEIPSSFYPVNSTNNVINVRKLTGLVEYIVTLTPGSYDATELAVEIQSKLNSLVYSGFVVTYNASTAKFTIANSSSNFELRTGPSDKLIGFDGVDTGDIATWTSDNVIHITGPDALYIRSARLLNEESLFDNDQRDIIAKIPVFVNFGATITLEGTQSDFVVWYNSSRLITAIDLRLEDLDGNELDLNGLDWSIEFQFSLADD